MTDSGTGRQDQEEVRTARGRGGDWRAVQNGAREGKGRVLEKAEAAECDGVGPEGTSAVRPVVKVPRWRCGGTGLAW